MTVDYDLVVVGPTQAAETAAIAAAKSFARVAWVTPTVPEASPLLLVQAAAACTRSLLPERIAWALTLQDTWTTQHAVAAVKALGVNYQSGHGSLHLRARSLQVNQQTWRSRAMLLALESTAALPELAELDPDCVCSVADLWQHLVQGKACPGRVAVLGHTPQAIELSQSLNQLGSQVSLLTNGQGLLPQEDPEIATLSQTYLEASGIQLHTHPVLTVTQPQDTDGGGLISIAGMATPLAVDVLLVALDQPCLTSPLLQDLKQVPGGGIWVNSALQTSMPRVYACGPLLGGYNLPAINDYEARIATQNALFEQRSPVAYHAVPYSLRTAPPLARVGYTEAQARQQMPEIVIVQTSYQACDRAVLEQTPTGLCKVILEPNGQILGAHLLGPAADETIHLFALAIQHHIPLQSLAELAYGWPTFARCVQHLAQEWHHQQQRQQRNRLEKRFYRRRQRTR